MKILIINGPNLNLLGKREPEKYGDISLEDIQNHILSSFADISIEFFQSNYEGAIVEKIQQAQNVFDGIVINAGGYSHTSVAIRDAVSAVDVPCVEVHITNVFAREDFRQQAIIAPVCIGQITGFGKNSYILGIKAVCDYINNKK